MINVYLKDDIWTVKAPVPPLDEFNVPFPPIVTAIKARIEWKTKQVKNLQGVDVVSSMQVLLKFDSDLGHEDKLRITDPAQGGNKDYAIINIDRAKDFSSKAIWVYL